MQKEKSKLEKAKDVTGLEHLKKIEELLQSDKVDRKNVLDAVKKYGLHTGAVNSQMDIFIAMATGTAGNFLKLLANKFIKDGLKNVFDEWRDGGGFGETPKDVNSLLPGKGENWVKLKGDQGWKNLKEGTIWKKDQLHKDHWDISDSKGNKIREVDFFGRQIWPDGPKNKNKK